MKKILIAMIAIVALASCKKEKTAMPQAPAEKKVLQVQETGPGYTGLETFTYNPNGGLATYIHDNLRRSFSYPGTNQVLTQRTNTATGENFGTEEMTLNASGAIIKWVYKYANGSIFSTTNFTYDAEGRKINQKSIQFDGSTTEVQYEYVSSTVIKTTNKSNNTILSVVEYTLDPSKSNKANMVLGSIFLDAKLEGKPFPYHIAQRKSFNTSGTLTSHYVYANQLDAQGYPVQITETKQSTGEKTFINYQFK